MSDMLRDGQAWLANQLATHASREITYRRGALSACLRATIGNTEYEQDNGEGPIVRYQVRDFLINAQSLLNSNIASLPMQGDRIEERDGANIFIHEVVGLGGSPAWRYSDPFRLTLRIHTKQIKR